MTEFVKLQVINETVRLANIVPGIFRKTMRETKFKGMDLFFNFYIYFIYIDVTCIDDVVCCGAGYTIPAGWAVMVCPPAVHLNPSKYKDPMEFNPWRWEASICVCNNIPLYSSNPRNLLIIEYGICREWTRMELRETSWRLEGA